MATTKEQALQAIEDNLPDGSGLKAAAVRETLETIVDAIPDAGSGTAGLNGWTPVLSIATDGARKVQRVTDWTGSTGTKPATGLYVGPSGFVALIADAVDIRGAQGVKGDTGNTGPQGPKGDDGSGSSITVDPVPVSGSANPVGSGGVFTALAGKQPVLTIDSFLAFLSNNGSVIFTKDGAQARGDMNWNFTFANFAGLPDTPATVLFQGRAADLYVNKSQYEADIAYLMMLINDPSSADDPSLIAGLVGWYKADTGITQTAGAVSAWADQSGTGNNLVSSADYDKPVYNATGGSNNKPYLHFDGNHFLHNDAFNLVTPGLDLTVFYLLKNNDGGKVSYLSDLNGHGTSNGYADLLNENISESINSSTTGANGDSIRAANLPESVWSYVHTQQWKSLSTDESIPYVNGVAGNLDLYGQHHDADNNEPFANGPFSLGGHNGTALFMKADLSELLIYNRALSPVEISGVENYLKNKYTL